MSEVLELTIGHSPDPDDAFMWWPLGSVDPAEPHEATVDVSPFGFRPIAQDIEQLNARALDVGDLDITAMSFHTAVHAAERYVLTACGASIGDGYGPKIVANRAMETGELRNGRIAVPGVRTTAYLTTRLMLGEEWEAVAMPFETVTHAVQRGEVDAGIVIHEAQLTYADMGLHLVADLGAWWAGHTGGLPLPLGANAVRADLDERFGAGTLERLEAVLRSSIEYAMVQRERGLDHAAGFAQPGTTREQADTFIGMYVNALTLDMGARGEEAFARLVREGREAGLLPEGGAPRVVRG